MRRSVELERAAAARHRLAHSLLICPCAEPVGPHTTTLQWAEQLSERVASLYEEGKRALARLDENIAETRAKIAALAGGRHAS